MRQHYLILTCTLLKLRKSSSLSSKKWVWLAKKQTKCDPQRKTMKLQVRVRNISYARYLQENISKFHWMNLEVTYVCLFTNIFPFSYLCSIEIQIGNPKSKIQNPKSKIQNPKLILVVRSSKCLNHHIHACKSFLTRCKNLPCKLKLAMLSSRETSAIPVYARSRMSIWNPAAQAVTQEAKHVWSLTNCSHANDWNGCQDNECWCDRCNCLLWWWVSLLAIVSREAFLAKLRWIATICLRSLQYAIVSNLVKNRYFSNTVIPVPPNMPDSVELVSHNKFAFIRPLMLIRWQQANQVIEL